VESEITSTPDYARLVTMWATCMSDHGYQYTDPEQPRRKAWAGRRPGADEIATALQDAACKSDVGLTQFGDHLFNKIVSDWFFQYPGRFAEISDYVQGVTDRANAILSS
jgi:hypothetical protein